jgi:hypothetical protein
MAGKGRVRGRGRDLSAFKKELMNENRMDNNLMTK